MSALGHKRTLGCSTVMSALPPKAGHSRKRQARPLSAKSRHRSAYWITSSAEAGFSVNAPAKKAPTGVTCRGKLV